MSEAPVPQPDRSLMLRHVEQVFGGSFDGALDGLVELAWTDPANGALRHGQLFGTDQLEELAERGEALNRIDGCNVYLGAALRKPGTVPDRRASDAAFHSAPFAWADIDDDCVDAAIRAAKAAGVAPTMTVVTGRHPHVRAQLWWRLVEAERDGAAIKVLCSGIGLALGGDSTVSNPSRVLRLGGSIAWPVKPGRIREATEIMGVAAKAGIHGTPAKSPPTAPADDARKDRRFGFVNFWFRRMSNSVRLMFFPAVI